MHEVWGGGTHTMGGGGGGGNTGHGTMYTWYIRGTYCQLGDYMLPTYHLFRSNLKNLLSAYLIGYHSSAIGPA